MKYAFIINPMSGKKHHDADVVPKVEKLMEDYPEHEIKYFFTQGMQDATVLADQIAREAAPEEVVVFACGGDGTIQEVANGLYGNDNAILAIYPCGSGNDFVRTLGGDANAKPRFLDLDNQMKGTVDAVDILRLSYEENGETVSRIVMNGINIGFDGNTAITARDMRKSIGIPGSMSYGAALAVNFVGKKGGNVHIIADGEEFYHGPLLLVTASNGAFCGGGFQSCPRADLNDGLAELLVIKDIKRRQFPALLPKYLKGQIFEVKNIEEFTNYTQAKRIEIEPLSGDTMSFVADGEIMTTGRIIIETLPEALKVLCV